MKYIDFKEEDFIKDEYFQKWVLSPDTMTSNFWNNWVKEHPEKAEIIKSAKNFVKQLNAGETKLHDSDFDDMWQYIVQNKKTSKHSLKRLLTFRISMLEKVAAVLIIALCLGYFVKYTEGIFNTSDIQTPDVPRITLEMEDGTIKYLDEVSSEVIVDKKGEQIVRKSKTQLAYDDNKSIKSLRYNQLTVPYGKKFELLLSDGSQVHLNSGSKLKYPVKFMEGKPRDVFLDGEAFFDVAKDSTRAFTVITNEMNTQVYGTSFNVSSYKNENNTSTVLVEGSIGVYKSNNAKAEPPIFVKPGKRAVLEDGLIYVEKVNISKYIAWKDNKLVFIDDRFDVIAKELERHFNVEIRNQITALNQKTFTGTFTKETLEDILKVFREHSGFNFSEENNTYTISNN